MKRDAHLRQSRWLDVLRRMSGPGVEMAAPLRSVAREYEEAYHLFD